MNFLSKINFSKLTYLFVFLIILSNCTKVDSTTGEKVLIETDAKKRAEAEARKGGGIFGDIGKRNSNTNFEFATSNILWRATLKSLEFLPLLNADYSGGIIIYDWYSQPNNSKEQIKKVLVMEIYSLIYSRGFFNTLLKDSNLAQDIGFRGCPFVIIG